MSAKTHAACAALANLLLLELERRQAMRQVISLVHGLDDADFAVVRDLAVKADVPDFVAVLDKMHAEGLT